MCRNMGTEKVVYEIVSKTEKHEPQKSPNAPKGFGARHGQVLILFISLTVIFTIRSQLSVSMVAMISHDLQTNVTCIDRNITEHDTGSTHIYINTTDVNLKNSSRSNYAECQNKVLSKWTVYRKYDWDKATQEMILFSFFVGYTSMMLPMGILAQKFGGKIPIMVALAVNGVLSILIPWVAIFGGWIGICVCRLLQGMTQASMYPCIHNMLGKWAPLSERGRLSTYIYSGSQFGTIVIFQISGLFAGSPSLGWPATFWLCGVLSLICFGLLTWCGAANPHEHRNISVEEISFILEGGDADVIPKKRRTPWRSILKSKAVWGLVIAHMGSTCGYLLVLTEIPTYMNSVLGVEIKKNGVYSSLPYIAMYLTSILFGNLADYASNNKILSIANIRRIGNTVGIVVSGAFLVGFSYVTQMVPAIIMLMITMGLHSAIGVGFHINSIDLAPNFAGPIMALGNMMANLASLLVPVIVSNIVKDDLKNQQRWQIVFLIFAAVQFITNIVFIIFVKGKVQPWNFYGDVQNEEERNPAMGDEEENGPKEKKHSIS